MCRLVPLWIQTLVHLEIEPLALISVRHPAEVAASLQTRNAFDPALSNLLWLRHVLDAERYTRGITRSVFKFNDLLCDWRRTVRRIGEDLQIGWPIAPQSAAMEIDGFLSPDDRHYWADRNHDNLPDLVSAVYEALVNETEVNRKRWDQRNWDHLRAELDRATAIYGDLLSNKEYEVAALKASLDEAEREIEHLNADRSALLSSRSWRITAPLRTIAGSRAKKRDVLP